MSGDTVLAFCLSPDRFEIVQDICSRSELKKRIDFLNFHLSRAAMGPDTTESRARTQLLNVHEHLYRLYSMLVGPLEEFLAGRESLVIVPFDFLHYFPFHALYDGSKYLIDKFTISYAPTATIYRLFRTKHADVDTTAPVLIGIPDARAPFIRDEIETLRTIFPNARTFIGAEATKERVTREMQPASLIHIASHAHFRPDNPMFSSIQLHDAPLNFFGIYQLRTSATLVTLSGCGTGLSSIVAGDELLGLVRGFLYAGATSVLISLWDVNDRTTVALMQNFYGALTRGLSKGESLREAMLQLRQSHPHPYYWAPFVLMGDHR